MCSLARNCNSNSATIADTTKLSNVGLKRYIMGPSVFEKAVVRCLSNSFVIGSNCEMVVERFSELSNHHVIHCIM